MRKLIGLLCLALSAASASEQGEAFYAGLIAQCGARFEGETVFPDDPGDDFRDQRLVAEFIHCDDEQVRISFAVGENRSRTWVITPKPGGIELKHDHRHADGTPDEITNYGGTTVTEGTALTQSFPADAFTAELIPEAATNVWTLSLSEDGQKLVYNLTRHDRPRYRAVLGMVE